jgi:hypothetical protein
MPRRIKAAPGAPVMSARYKSAISALADGPLAGLIDQALLLDRIASVVADVSLESKPATCSGPPLRCALRGRTLVITAVNPSQAAKLRQRLAALREALGECAPEVTAIRIRLQPAGSADPVSGSPPGAPAGGATRPPASRESLSAALGFADSLATGLRESPLRRSAQRLQASLRARLEGRD